MTIDLHDWAREVFGKHERRAESMEKASIESANLALKSLLLLNGGACIALLGFLASVFSSDAQYADKVSALQPFISALIKFTWGAAFAVLATAVAYFVNSYYARGLMAYDKSFEWPYVKSNDQADREWRIGSRLNLAAVLVAAVSMGMFVWGIISVSLAY
ncbi:MAG: hypothetical protein Q7T44_06070 [Parvibaculum sp.]|nr:hypothetical protein [Parvibaculum sp.]